MQSIYSTAFGPNGSALPLDSLPLFGWANLAEQSAPSSLPALIFAARFGLPEATAAVVAQLAGFHAEGRDHG